MEFTLRSYSTSERKFITLPGFTKNLRNFSSIELLNRCDYHFHHLAFRIASLETLLLLINGTSQFFIRILKEKVRAIGSSLTMQYLGYCRIVGIGRRGIMAVPKFRESLEFENSDRRIELLGGCLVVLHTRQEEEEGALLIHPSLKWLLTTDPFYYLTSFFDWRETGLFMALAGLWFSMKLVFTSLHVDLKRLPLQD